MTNSEQIKFMNGRRYEIHAETGKAWMPVKGWVLFRGVNNEFFPVRMNHPIQAERE